MYKFKKPFIPDIHIKNGLWHIDLPPASNDDVRWIGDKLYEYTRNVHTTGIVDQTATGTGGFYGRVWEWREKQREDTYYLDLYQIKRISNNPWRSIMKMADEVD